jgi:mono/diheme cytochrome c family protein
MEHVRQLQLALTILLTALVLLIVAGGALFYVSQPGKATAVVTTPQKAEEAKDPQPEGAQTVALDAAAEQGKKIFSDNCQVCHSLGADKLIGPGLKDVTKRRPEAWLVSWIRNSQKVIESGDKYAVELFNAYNKTPMPPYAFSDDEIKSVLKYIETSGK